MNIFSQITDWNEDQFAVITVLMTWCLWSVAGEILPKQKLRNMQQVAFDMWENFMLHSATHKSK